METCNGTLEVILVTFSLKRLHTGYDATGSTMGLANYRYVQVRFQMADISTGGHYTHGQRFLTNMAIDCFSAQYRKKESHDHLL